MGCWAITESQTCFGMFVALRDRGLHHGNRKEQSRFVKPQNRSRQCGLAIHHTSKGIGFAGLVG